MAFPTEGSTITHRQKVESKKWLLWLNGICFTITSTKAYMSHDEILVLTVTYLHSIIIYIIVFILTILTKCIKCIASKFIL